MQSGAHDFLLTFHSNHRPISHRFRDKQRCRRKSHENHQSPRVFNAPAEGFPMELCINAGVQETRMMGLSDGRKSFQIGLAILIQYRSVTDTQPASQPPMQPRCRSKYRAYAQVKVCKRKM